MLTKHGVFSYLNQQSGQQDLLILHPGFIDKGHSQWRFKSSASIPQYTVRYCWFVPDIQEFSSLGRVLSHSFEVMVLGLFLMGKFIRPPIHT